MTDPATLLAVIRAAGLADVPVLLWGSPGTGKSALVASLGRLDGLRTVTVIGSLHEPADLAGLPVVQADGSVALAPPRWARELDDADGGYLFLDELSTAAPAVQAAMLRVAMDKIAGDLALPAATRIVAAANPADVAAGGWELEPPTANRFCHLTHQPDLDTFLDGLAGGFDHATAQRDTTGLRAGDATDRARATGQIAGFLRARPHHFQNCPTDPAEGGGAWPSPRTWHHLQRLLAFLPDDAVEARHAAAAGLVGEGAAVELLTWMRHSDLPDPAAVLDGDEPFDAHARDDQVFAVLSGVAAVAVARGTAEAWHGAWQVLRAASVDVAAVAARTLFAARPADAAVPDAVADFAPMLRKAGLLRP